MAPIALTVRTADPQDPPSASTTTSSPGGGVDGRWQVTTGSQAGHRVPEILDGQRTEAVGRTSGVTGTLTLAGTQATEATFAVDLTTVASDEGRRDNQFRGRIMDVANHPRATSAWCRPSTSARSRRSAAG